jgi:hypothetical protein
MIRNLPVTLFRHRARGDISTYTLLFLAPLPEINQLSCIAFQNSKMQNASHFRHHDDEIVMLILILVDVAYVK